MFVCCRKIWIPPADPIINCKLSAPKIGTNTARDRYIPMPFILTADISNDGGLESDSLFATINFSPDLRLTSTPNNVVTKVVSPYKLFPGQHGTVTWELDHPISLDQKDYIVTVCIRQKNIDTTCCEIPIIIPAIVPPPSLLCHHTCPDSLTWIDSIGKYVPNPFIVTHAVVNTGGEDADSVRSTIYLPPDLVLDPPTQSLTKFFNPMRIVKWKQGLPVNEVAWTVRATKIPNTRKWYTIGLRVDGVGSTGPTDPAYCDCDVWVPGVQPMLMCKIYAPDSLVLDSTRTRVRPNPFIVRIVVDNIGYVPFGVREALLTIYNGPGVSLSPNSQNPIQFNKMLQPGDSVSATFKMVVTNSLIFRRPRFTITTIDEDGNALECWIEIPIAATDSLVSVKPMQQPISVFVLEQNYPNPFSSSTTISFNLSPTLSLNKERESIGQHRATLKVFDVFGREVLDLSERIVNCQLTIYNFQLKNPGVYFYRLTIGKESQTRIMMFLK